MKWSLDGFADPNVNRNYKFLSAIESTKVLDARHVRVRLKYAQGSFLDNIGHFTASIIPRKLIERIGEAAFAKNPIGSGAFTFKSREAGRSLTLARNESYWRDGKPYVDEVHFQYVPDDNARILQVVSGPAHVASPIPFSQLDRRREEAPACASRSSRSGPSPTSTSTTTSSRSTSPRCASRSTTPRRATAFARASTAARPTSPTARSRSCATGTRPSRSTRTTSSARERSSRSRACPTASRSPTCSSLATPTRARRRRSCRTPGARSGWRLELQQVDIATFDEKRNKNDFEILAGPADEFTSDIAADDELAIILYDPRAVGFGGYTYSDPRAKRILDSATRTADEQTRRTQFVALQEYGMYTNPPWVPLGFVNQRTAVKESVQGLSTMVTGFWRLEDVWIGR